MRTYAFHRMYDLRGGFVFAIELNIELNIEHYIELVFNSTN